MGAAGLDSIAILATRTSARCPASICTGVWVTADFAPEGPPYLYAEFRFKQKFELVEEGE